MKLKLTLFGITKEIIGQACLEYMVSGPVDVSGLMRGLKTDYPKLESLATLAVAVNGEYARGDLPLTENDEIVLIPPVSGG